MSLYPDCKEATAEELKSGYDFGANAVRAFIQSGENVSPTLLLRLLEITDEIVQRSVERR